MDQGLPQFIQVNFEKQIVDPRRISLTFQGGFVGTRCVLQGQPAGSSEWKYFTEIYPEDANRQQEFALPPTEGTEWSQGLTALKLIFEQSSDFFGRITVYDLQIYGLTLS